MKRWAILGGVACAAVACEGNIVRLGTSGEGGGGMATSVASAIKEAPDKLVSDGTSLFWTTAGGGALSRMPVGGGPITAVLQGPVSDAFLAVDDVNVYFFDSSGEISRVPKNGGGPPTPVTQQSAPIDAVTTNGSSMYWVEIGATSGSKTVVKSAPLKGGAPSTLAEFSPSPSGQIGLIGVTATTVFLGSVKQLTSFPLGSGVPDGGVPASVPGGPQECLFLVSDTDAVYCDAAESIDRVASDGTTTMLGRSIDEITFVRPSLAFDDTYVYWADIATSGSILRVPKTGGTAAVIARDTAPVAIAVDAHAVYWSDQGGSIMRLAK